MADGILSLTEGKLAIEFGIREDGEQGFTVQFPADISAARMISALELVKGMVVYDTITGDKTEGIDPDDEDDDGFAP